jgi:hypothetical protein
MEEHLSEKEKHESFHIDENCENNETDKKDEINEKDISQKTLLTFIFSVLSLFLLFVSCNIISDNIHKYIDVIIGIIISISAIFFHKRRKKLTYVICIILNSIGNGFCVSALFSHYEVGASVEIVAKGILSALVLITLVFLISYFTGLKTSKAVGIALILNVALLILFFVLWIIYDSMIYPISFCSLIISSGYLFAFKISIESSKRNVMRDISLGSFGIFVSVAIIVLFVIIGGEAVGEAISDSLSDLFALRNKKSPK